MRIVHCGWTSCRRPTTIAATRCCGHGGIGRFLEEEHGGTRQKLTFVREGDLPRLIMVFEQFSEGLNSHERDLNWAQELGKNRGK